MLAYRKRIYPLDYVVERAQSLSDQEAYFVLDALRRIEAPGPRDALPGPVVLFATQLRGNPKARKIVERKAARHEAARRKALDGDPE